MSFKALKVWRSLKRNPGAMPHDLADDLGWDPHNVFKILDRLRRDGCAIRMGRTNSSQWFGTNVTPADLRGTAPESTKALERANEVRRGKPRPAYKPKPPVVKVMLPPPVPKPATALEECWGFGMLSATVARTVEPCSIALRAGLARPKET